MLQLISLVLVIYSYFLIKTNLPNLPRIIPTHFNGAGVANGWGSPDTLWVLLGAQALTCGMFLVMPYFSQRYPKLVHFGRRKLSEFSPGQRARMLTILNDMAGYSNILLNVFWVFMLMEILRASAQPIPRIHPLFPMVLLVGGMMGIMVYYMAQFRRVAKEEDRNDSPEALNP
jgi:uncharacterized membrane protein